MEKIDYLKQEQILSAQISIEQAEQARLAWNMVEHNQIKGIQPFEYYYLDDQVCFRYDVSSYHPMVSLLSEKKADFEIISFVCREIVQIIEHAMSFLLNEKDFLLKPEWLFGEFSQKTLVLCYLPGREPKEPAEFLQVLEFLMTHLDHGDAKATEFLYALYEFCASKHRSIEEISEFLAQQENREQETEQVPNSTERNTNNIETKTYQQKAEQTWNIGREETNTVFLPLATISRIHLKVIKKGEQLFLMDCASKNGTWLNGRKLPPMEQVVYQPQDIINMSQVTFRLSLDTEGNLKFHLLQCRLWK